MLRSKTDWRVFAPCLSAKPLQCFLAFCGHHTKKGLPRKVRLFLTERIREIILGKGISIRSSKDVKDLNDK